MAAPIVEGAPEDCTLAGGHGRGDRTGDDGGLVEGGVNAVGSAGVDAEVDATTSMTTAKMVARVGRARPAVPLEPQAEPMAPKIVLPTLTALLGWAGPAVPVESTMLLTTLLVPVPMVRRTAPTMPRTMLKVGPRTHPKFSGIMPMKVRAVLARPRKRSRGGAGGRLLVALGATTAGVGPARPLSAPSPSAVGSPTPPRLPGRTGVGKCWTKSSVSALVPCG